jgi:hypothetical protein
MSLELFDLPTVEGAGRLGRRPAADTEVTDMYRAHPDPPIGRLEEVGLLGAALGIDAVRVLQERFFPGAERRPTPRGGGGPQYTTYSDCADNPYDGTCNEACFGFAPHHMDPFYCATCDEQEADPVNNPPWNWHFQGSRGQIQYMDCEPDVCAGRDAWKWKVGACGDCHDSAVFRCHDGWKKYPDSQAWDSTICQGLVSCDGKLTLC